MWGIHKVELIVSHHLKLKESINIAQNEKLLFN